MPAFFSRARHRKGPSSRSDPEIPVDESGLNTGGPELGQGQLSEFFLFRKLFMPQNIQARLPICPRMPAQPRRRVPSRQPAEKTVHFWGCGDSSPLSSLCGCSEHSTKSGDKSPHSKKTKDKRTFNCPQPNPMLRWIRRRKERHPLSKHYTLTETASCSNNGFRQHSRHLHWSACCWPSRPGPAPRSWSAARRRPMDR